MSLASNILAYTPLENPGVSDAVPYLTGFLVVLVTLAVLMGLCMAVSKILLQILPQPQPFAKSTAASANNDEITPEVLAMIAAAAAVQGNENVPPHIIAVITAAVATTIGKKQRIISIKPQNSSWGQAGRQQIHTSHNIR
jgi:Na+-transporting methylmalonyl-CoA/oxaloacetate decarboxylase gamma subunit